MNKLRLSVILFSVLGIAGSIGPWFSNSMDNSTFMGIQGDGIVSLLLFALVLLFALLSRNFRNPIKKGLKISIFICALLASLFGVYKYFVLMEAFNTSVLGMNFSHAFSFGFGLYAIVAAGLLIVVAFFIFKDKAKTHMVV
jgi:hypothetical protein